jgi:hypothetical protein
VILQTIWASVDAICYGRRLTRTERIENQPQLVGRLTKLVPLITYHLPGQRQPHHERADRHSAASPSQQIGSGTEPPDSRGTGVKLQQGQAARWLEVKEGGLRARKAESLACPNRPGNARCIIAPRHREPTMQKGPVTYFPQLRSVLFRQSARAGAPRPATARERDQHLASSRKRARRRAGSHS